MTVPQPVVLVITTQTWPQITSLAMRLASYGCRIAAICPAECQLAFLPGLVRHLQLHPLHASRSIGDAIETVHADFVLPADDLSVWLLHELAAESPKFAGVIERSLGNPRHYSTVRSRFGVLTLAQQLGIATPKTTRIESLAALEDLCAQHSGSLVLKKDGTWGGNGVQFIREAEESQSAWLSLKQKESFPERVMRSLRCGDASAFIRQNHFEIPDITAQEYIEGPPANSMLACHEGRVLGEIQARVLVARGQSGPSLVIELIKDERIAHAGRALVQALGISGFVGFDFLLDEKTGVPLLLEMNPRCTKLGHVQTAGAADLAGTLWAQWTGTDSVPEGDERLSPHVYFSLEQTQELAATELVHNSRCDLSSSDQAAFTALPKDNPHITARLRRMLWRQLSQLNKIRGVSATPAPFYFVAHATPAVRQQNLQGMPSNADMQIS